MIIVIPPTSDLRAAPLRRLLPKLGERTGRHLRAAPDVAGIVVLVHSKGGDDSAVLASIARVTFGRWVAEGDGTLRLTLDPAAVNVQRRREREIAREGWRRGLDDIRKRIAGAPDGEPRRLARDADRFLISHARMDPGEKLAKLREFRLRAPGGRAMLRVIAALPDTAFLDRPAYGYAFADRPTRVQIPLPAACVNAVREWAREQGLFHDAARDLGLANRAKDLPSSDAFETEDAPGRLGRVVLRVSPDIGGDSVALGLRIYDAQGRLAKTLSGYVECLGTGGKGYGESTFPAREFDKLKVIDETARTPKLFLSEDALAHAALFGNLPASEKGASTVADPTRFDPLGGVAGEALARYADWCGHSIVTRIEDEGSPLALPDGTRVGDVPGRFRWLPPHPTVRDGVIEAVGDRPFRAETRRADRAILARLLKEAHSLEEVAEAAFTVHNAPQESLLRVLPDRVRSRRPASADETDGDQDWLAVYGGLTSEHRRRALDGGVRLGACAEGVRLIALARLYAWDASFGERIEDEPTVRWPNGPPDGVLNVAERAEWVLMGRPRVVPGSDGAPTTVGDEVRTPEEWAAERRTGDFRAGKRRRVSLRLRYDPEIGLAGEIEHRAWGPYGPPTSR